MSDIHQRVLTELLDEIARADARIDPPREMEQRVLDQVRDQWNGGATFRTARIRRKSLKPLWLIAGGGALAAAVLLIVVVYGPSGGATREIRDPRSEMPEALVPGSIADRRMSAPVTPVEAPPERAIPLAAGTQALGAGTRPLATVRTRPETRSQRVEPQREILSFVPLSPNAHQELIGSFQLARVLLPREVLADLGIVGIVLDASRAGEPIQADVVFGEDGLARAIRLAPGDVRRSQ